MTCNLPLRKDRFSYLSFVPHERGPFFGRERGEIKPRIGDSSGYKRDWYIENEDFLIVHLSNTSSCVTYSTLAAALRWVPASAQNQLKVSENPWNA